MIPVGLPTPPPAGTEVTDLDAILIGHIAGVYPDPATAVAEWAAVDLGELPGRVVLVPLAEAIAVFGGIQVPYRAEHLQHAPIAPASRTLNEADLTAAIDYYLAADGPGGSTDPTADPKASTDAQSGGEDLVVVRSEEQLRASTETIPVQRLRLRKYVVTEERTITVRLRREEFRIDQEPITDPAAGTPPPGADDPIDTLLGPGDDREAEIVLYAEQPVITTEVVPVERIRVSKYLVTDDQPVSGTVAREVIETEGVDEPS